MNKYKLTVSHAPFWHDGDSLFKMNLNILLAAMPAAVFGLLQFGMPAFGVLSLAVGTAMLWEVLFNLISKKPLSIGNLEAAVIGLIFGMMLPAVTPWWVIFIGTFVAIVIGKMIYGGIGANPFNPALVGMAILMASWPVYFDFDAALVNFEFEFEALAPLAAIKFMGVEAADLFPLKDLLMGKEVGSIGATFGFGIILGGIWLILKGYVRWEICLSFIAGILITALLFNMSDSEKYAGPLFHLFSGYTLLGAFFLMPENSSSPANRIPMLIYGFGGGLMIILMRNIGIYEDGTVLAILIMNLINPIVDNIRPKALGKGVTHA